jgi:hypothetical protein
MNTAKARSNTGPALALPFLFSLFLTHDLSRRRSPKMHPGRPHQRPAGDRRPTDLAHLRVGYSKYMTPLADALAGQLSTISVDRSGDGKGGAIRRPSLCLSLDVTPSAPDGWEKRR